MSFAFRLLPLRLSGWVSSLLRWVLTQADRPLPPHVRHGEWASPLCGQKLQKSGRLRCQLHLHLVFRVSFLLLWAEMAMMLAKVTTTTTRSLRKFSVTDGWLEWANTSARQRAWFTPGRNQFAHLTSQDGGILMRIWNGRTTETFTSVAHPN